MNTWKAAAVGVAVAVASAASAQGMRGPPPGAPNVRPGQQYMHLFDPATVKTTEGEVTGLKRVPHSPRMTGVHATVKTAEGAVTVHLGPSWFIDNQELQLKKGDKVTVTGSHVTYEGKPAIVATELKRGEDHLKLREPDGTPVWVAWRRTTGT